ncbi:MAPEG family protein [Montanilutibacter psychrotolerans]|uniref:MAPEG family protein n=1 Tax=Montanilutibacter psychrotolerans TaxID=1327343 RepID=UPI001CC1FBFE|nr:MAPEG family protein [Lysobacter psychrotolerans]
MTLSTAYWCVLIAAVLPYLWVAVAKGGGERYNNRDPRGWLARQDNPRVHRANGAQLNSYEAFAPFAAGVVLAQISGVPADRIALLAVAFVVLRVLHGIFYIADKHALRSLCWFAAFACVLALLAQAALAASA